MAAGDARVTHLPVEVLVKPDTSVVNARVSQLAVEVMIGPNLAAARVSQLAVEVMIGAAPPPSGSGARSMVVVAG
jgi:hypothetical protein